MGETGIDRSYSVATDDGAALYIEESGRTDAPVTVIFSHGWTLQMAAWRAQRAGLADVDAARLVFYDQRCHGRSSTGGSAPISIDRLAHDLHAVIATAAPRGPVVLVGHSLGGMAALALARVDPDLVAHRLAAIALISTSAAETSGGWGRFAQINGANPLLPLLAAGAARYPRLVQRGRVLSARVVWQLTRLLGFGSTAVPAALVDELDAMISATPIDVIVRFAPAVFRHDETDTLPAFAHIPALVMVGTKDRMTPPSRAREIAAALPRARLITLDGAGHMAIMERADAVTAELRALLRPVVRDVVCAGRSGDGR